MTSEKDKYIKRVKECMNKNNDYKNFKYFLIHDVGNTDYIDGSLDLWKIWKMMEI